MYASIKGALNGYRAEVLDMASESTLLVQGAFYDLMGDNDMSIATDMELDYIGSDVVESVEADSSIWN
jgi:hypothetical protein